MSIDATGYTAEQLARFDSIELQHRQLAQRNPVIAAQFYEQHARSIEVARTRHTAGNERLLPNVDAPRLKSIEEVLGIDGALKYR